MGTQQKAQSTLAVVDLQKVIRSEQHLHPLITALAVPFDDDRPYFGHDQLPSSRAYAASLTR
jgi:hypothetical protein